MFIYMCATTQWFRLIWMQASIKILKMSSIKTYKLDEIYFFLKNFFLASFFRKALPNNFFLLK